MKKEAEDPLLELIELRYLLQLALIYATYLAFIEGLLAWLLSYDEAGKKNPVTMLFEMYGVSALVVLGFVYALTSVRLVRSRVTDSGRHETREETHAITNDLSPILSEYFFGDFDATCDRCGKKYWQRHWFYDWCDNCIRTNNRRKTTDGRRNHNHNRRKPHR